MKTSSLKKFFRGIIIYYPEKLSLLCVYAAEHERRNVYGVKLYEAKRGETYDECKANVKRVIEASIS